MVLLNSVVDSLSLNLNRSNFLTLYKTKLSTDQQQLSYHKNLLIQLVFSASIHQFHALFCNRLVRIRIQLLTIYGHCKLVANLNILHGAGLSVGEVHVIGDLIHLQCVFKEIIQDALGCILDIGSH